ncbi:hypothetical protein F5X68DRAFT_177034 [Plectosphaerella plurivora]|uniref:Zn(2)-C6 fungal-type domain-containing protein n=1 Tax=Plectosphaerella plurivora TaxID=936078 RepID=A0A9P8V201_9PEZI|nr:hypothetical protein F5X68DRAFT_177034 [Plectosphaerella plurivora]
MPPGPFDRRTRRSRCTRCAQSHTKCSGHHPCTRCQARGILCVFPSPVTTETTIVLHTGRHLTPATYGLPSHKSPLPRMPSPTEPTETYLRCFDTFIQRNSFTGGDPSFLADVQSLAKTSSPSSPSSPSSSTHLMNAMLALGAMQAHALDPDRPRAALHFALDAYARSISDLRTAVAEAPAPHAGILWSTFFLGLFELMQDPSGQRWLQHMVFGTSRALTAIGPARIRSGPLRTFFTQVRAFEVCRSIIFNDASFLATPEWVDAVRDMGERQLPEEILEIVALCAGLRARTETMIESLETPSEGPAMLLPLAQSIALEGFQLRATLDDWAIAATLIPHQSPEMLLATAYHAAASIHLSGNFDYELQHWLEMGMEVPVLAPADVLIYFDTIIRSTRLSLKATSLSAVLFLFPLRVAGARAHTKSQQNAVAELLEEVKERFIVGDAILSNLRELWAFR